MSKKNKLTNEGAGGCTVSSNEIIEDLQDTVIEQNGHIEYLNRVLFEKDGQIIKVNEQQAAFAKTAEHMQKQMVMSHLQERTDLVARLMRIDQRLAVLGVRNPSAPDAFALVVNNLND